MILVHVAAVRSISNATENWFKTNFLAVLLNKKDGISRLFCFLKSESQYAENAGGLGILLDYSVGLQMRVDDVSQQSLNAR